MLPVHYRGELATLAFVDDEDYPLARQRRWHIDAVNRYPYATRNERNTSMHRALLGLVYGDGKVVHHINEVKTDNRRKNLRVCESTSEHARIYHRRRDDWRVRVALLEEQLGVQA